MSKRIGASLRHHRAKGMVKSVGGVGTSLRGRLQSKVVANRADSSYEHRENGRKKMSTTKDILTILSTDDN